MKKFHKSICLASLTLLFSACSVSQLGSSKEVLVNENLPKIIDLKSISDTSNVAFEWQPLYAENIEGFYLYRSSEKESESKRIAVIKDKFQTHYVDTKLEPATRYFYHMKSFNSQGHISEDGQVIEIATAPRMEALAFVQVLTNLPERIKLIWRPHHDLRVDSYIIERKSSDDKDFKQIAKVKHRLSAEYIDDDLKPNQTFLYRVFAQSFDGVKSEPSEVLSSTSKALPPEVLNLQASKDLSGKISLSWDKAEYADFSYYKVYASGGLLLPYTLLAKTQENHYDDIINGADKSKTYKVTMVDKDELESPMPKEGVEGKTLGKPKAPSIILARSMGDGIEVEWSDNDTRAVEYTLLRYGGEQDAVFKGLREKRLKDTKALPGVEYEYEVISIDEKGLESEPSKRVKAKQ